jgi:hypothetical protein
MAPAGHNPRLVPFMRHSRNPLSGHIFSQLCQLAFLPHRPNFSPENATVNATEPNYNHRITIVV